MNKKAEIVRVYLPPDANTLLSTYDHCLRSRQYVNVVVLPDLKVRVVNVVDNDLDPEVRDWVWPDAQDLADGDQVDAQSR